MQSTFKNGKPKTNKQNDVLSDDLHAAAAKQKRTAGLKILDMIIYPVLNNFVVFGISVGATYLTRHGDEFTGDGMAAKTARWLKKRGDKFMGVAQNNFNMSHEQAETSKIVFFSFLDGSVMAPVIKLFEDRREKIARGIDKLLGTVPKDESVYAAEPKQTWKSILLGRAATALIVAPTALLLDRVKVDGHILNKETGVWEEGRVSLNRKLFENPGIEVGTKLKNSDSKYAENFKKKFPKINITSLTEIGIFEAFYTSVCTATLMVASRFIAKRDDKKFAEKLAETVTQDYIIIEKPTKQEPAELEETLEEAEQKEIPRKNPNFAKRIKLAEVNSEPAIGA